MILQLDRGCWHFLSTALTDNTKCFLFKHRLCIGLMFKVTEKSSKNILASCQMSNSRFAWTFFELLYINSPSLIISHLFNNHPHCQSTSLFTREWKVTSEFIGMSTWGETSGVSTGLSYWLLSLSSSSIHINTTTTSLAQSEFQVVTVIVETTQLEVGTEDKMVRLRSEGISHWIDGNPQLC